MCRSSANVWKYGYDGFTSIENFILSQSETRNGTLTRNMLLLLQY